MNLLFSCHGGLNLSLFQWLEVNVSDVSKTVCPCGLLEYNQYHRKDHSEHHLQCSSAYCEVMCDVGSGFHCLIVCGAATHRHRKSEECENCVYRHQSDERADCNPCEWEKNCERISPCCPYSCDFVCSDYCQRIKHGCYGSSEPMK